MRHLEANYRTHGKLDLSYWLWLYLRVSSTQLCLLFLIFYSRKKILNIIMQVLNHCKHEQGLIKINMVVQIINQETDKKKTNRFCCRKRTLTSHNHRWALLPRQVTVISSPLQRQTKLYQHIVTVIHYNWPQTKCNCCIAVTHYNLPQTKCICCIVTNSNCLRRILTSYLFINCTKRSRYP